MTIVWKRNNNGGSNAYVGKVRIGQYFWNGIDPSKGQYKVTCLLPQSGIEATKVSNEIEARNLMLFGFNEFMKRLNDNN